MPLPQFKAQWLGNCQLLPSMVFFPGLSRHGTLTLTTPVQSKGKAPEGGKRAGGGWRQKQESAYLPKAQ